MALIRTLTEEMLIAKDAEIAALRGALLAAQKAMRPFEWASQYVDHRLVGEPMVKQFKVAVGKLTVGNFNELAIAVTQTRAALEMSESKAMSVSDELLRASWAKLAHKGAEIAALREALEPFAELALGIPDATHDAAPACRIGQDAKFPGTFTTISNGQFRRARAALEMSGGAK